MTRSSKLIIGFLVFLSLIFAIEVVYFFSPLRKGVTTTNTNPPFPSLVPTLKVNPYSTLQDALDTNADKFKQYGALIKDKVLTSLLITATYKCKVQSIVKEKGMTPDEMFPYQYVAKLTINLTNNNTRTLYISQNDVAAIKVYKTDSSNKEVQGKLDDLKSGDNITMVLTSDFMKKPGVNLVDATIKILTP